MATGSFSLLAVLGSGSSRLSCHHRTPLAAYQAGSILALWDYTRVGEESRKFILLQPGQRCTQIFFSKDARHLLGFWRSSNGQPMLTLWTKEGSRVSEHPLSDVAASSPLWVDFHRETQHLVLVHGSSVLSASVTLWDSEMGLRPLARGPLGAGELLALRLVADGRHFASAEVDAVNFWSYGYGAPRQVLRVDLTRPLKAFEVEGSLAYLLPEKGKLQVMNFQGEREQVAQTPPVQPTCIAVRNSTVCLGCDNGSLLVARSPCPTHWKSWPCPLQLCDVSPGIISVSLGSNEDYACVCFEDATHGVLHLSSGQYVALRAGHVGSIRSIAMAPQLRAPSSLAGRVLDVERILRTRALAFLSVGSERQCLTGAGLGCIAWPKQGPPARGLLQRLPELPLQGLESLPTMAPGQRTALTAAVFHPAACLAADGSLNGAYVLIAGSEDGTVHLLQAEGRGTPDQAMVWCSTRVRPREEAAAAACCHLDASPCGNFVLASFCDGAVDMLEFPLLTRLVQPQYSQGLEVGARQKAMFVWRPTATQRAYDTNVYVVSRTGNPWEAVLHEIYPLGDSFVKASKVEFVLAKVCQAAGGSFTDLCVHPSQLYLVAAAVLPSSNARSILLVYDLWSGEMLKSCEVFSSLLVAPKLPMNPSICMDCSGSFVFCASTPALMGPADLQFTGEDRGADGLEKCSDLLHSSWAAPFSTACAAEATSVVCIVDFSTGEQCYQASINASCISSGSPWHDPCQLLVGARDGTISVWQPPDAVTSRVRSMLQNSLEVHGEVGETLRQQDPSSWSLSPSLSHVEEAVSFLWATKLYGAMDWASWGESPNPRPRGVEGQPPLRPLLPVAPLAPAPAAAMPEDDVVVNARRQWAMTAGPSGALSFAPEQTRLSPERLRQRSGAPAQPLAPLASWVFGTRERREEPEVDPVSGLEVFEMPAPYARSRLPVEPAELLGPAPELREEFGSRPEHFQDPLPSLPAPTAPVPRWLEQGRAPLPGRPNELVKTVVSELDRFELAHPDAQVPESPRSEAEVA